MDNKQEFLKRILATFKLEAEENINAISAQLIELENGCSAERQEEIFELIYRSAHSMKGASRAVNLSDIEGICHAFEDVMSAIRNNQVILTQELIDLFNDVIDLLAEILFENDGVMSEELTEKTERMRYALSCAEAGEPIPQLKKMKKAPKQKTEIKSNLPEKEKNEHDLPKKEEKQPEEASDVVVKQTTTVHKLSTSDTVRISSARLDKVLNQAEEMLTLKLASKQRIRNLRAMLNDLRIHNQREQALEKSHKAILKQLEEDGHAHNIPISALLDLLKHQVVLSQYLSEAEVALLNVYDQAVQDDFATAISIESLLNEVKEIITVPFSVLLDGYPKMVRDIAKDLDKRINFKVEGDTIEVDRRILENLRTPLMHILRNAIDYGIEEPEVRVKQGKSEKGNIRIAIDQPESGKVSISVSDDGAGLNVEKLKKLYIQHENIAEEDIESVKAEEYLAYIFKSGISTSDIVTDLSGRGLGLAIVQESIEQMEGQVKVETKPGKYTRFNILLPISILTYRGVLVSACKRHFIVPTSKVKSVLRITKDQLSSVENKITLPLEGKQIPVADLGLLLGLNTKREDDDCLKILILKEKKKNYALVVDAIVAEQEVLVKPFNKQLKRVRNIAGATVLGTGEVVPILNVTDLYHTMLGQSTPIYEASSSKDEKSKRKVLVVEDSITSRTLLKNVLESRGYEVVTAIDGLDGYNKLVEIADFDAVMSDVEMPRMNGFELTAKIRETKGFGIIPVVLITSLSTREHKQRGVEVGANAYIVKGDFKQNNLFEVLDSLIVK